MRNLVSLNFPFFSRYGKNIPSYRIDENIDEYYQEFECSDCGKIFHDPVAIYLHRKVAHYKVYSGEEIEQILELIKRLRRMEGWT